MQLFLLGHGGLLNASDNYDWNDLLDDTNDSESSGDGPQLNPSPHPFNCNTSCTTVHIPVPQSLFLTAVASSILILLIVITLLIMSIRRARIPDQMDEESGRTSERQFVTNADAVTDKPPTYAEIMDSGNKECDLLPSYEEALKIITELGGDAHSSNISQVKLENDQEPSTSMEATAQSSYDNPAYDGTSL